ncbi:MAG TPA: DUF6020 family protein, partial [Propionibacteriaceae bacterium]|nr:DUF6020 family protein [Propionibacteriaceae bacterium]
MQREEPATGTAPRAGVPGSVASTIGALAVVAMMWFGTAPNSLALLPAEPPLAALAVLVSLLVLGTWVVRRAPASTWVWAGVVGAAMAAADIMGVGLYRFDALWTPLWTQFGWWAAIHTLGVWWIGAVVVAGLIVVLDRPPSASSGERGRRSLTEARGERGLRAALASGEPRRQWRAAALVVVLLIVVELPYLVVYWPGIMSSDTMRSYAYARGLNRWDSYEPVGHSILIAITQWLGPALGLGDTGGVALGVAFQLLTSTAAFAFMLTRMAVWGVGPRLWRASLAWLAVLPVFGYFDVTLLKDTAFSAGVVVFLTAVGELSFGGRGRPRWPWFVLAVSGAWMIGMRNNGIYALALGVPALLLVLRRERRRLLMLMGVLAAAYALYVGPLYAALHVAPGRDVEMFSIPIQQLARVDKYDAADLSPADRSFLISVFAGAAPEALGGHYVPQLSDPMKLQALKAWNQHTTLQFLTGWLRVVADHPGTAIEATLANTMGAWDPAGVSYDGLPSSANDVRGIHLNIPTLSWPAGSLPKTVDAATRPTHEYFSGPREDGYLAVPVLGLLMSPGATCWGWIIALVLVVRRRSAPALALFLPAAALGLTVMAGPVSGG